MTDDDAKSQDDVPPLPSDDELLKAGWIKISRRERRIQSRPRVWQVYWVDFPRDAYEPEFVGEHPGVVVRAARSLQHDTCVVIPLTTRDQEGSPFTYKLTVNPNPYGKPGDSFAVCDHLYTVNNCRLRPLLDRKSRPRFVTIDKADAVEIVERIKAALATALEVSVDASEPKLEPANDEKKRHVEGPKTLHLKPKA